MRLGTLNDNLLDRLKEAVVNAIPGADVVVSGGGGHFTIEVTSQVFQGKSPLQSQRLVYAAIKDLMAGDSAPVHAIDKLITRTP
jgi:acid stress-induced BolA-like protein IbaG/YrbA